MGERSGAPSGFSPASIVISKPPVAVHLPQPDVSDNRDAPQAQAPVWHVEANYHLERKKPYVNHYSFHILDRDWGHVTSKISGHPPFPAQVILNGHEYVACQARKAGIGFIKNGNCFTAISNTSSFAEIAETLSEQRAVGRLREVCERWVYRSCLCFALDFEEQQRSGFRYHFSNYQMEYSRNLIFVVGGRMEQGLPGPDRSQPSAVGPDDDKDDPWRQGPAKIPPTQHAGGRMGSRGRETYV